MKCLVLLVVLMIGNRSFAADQSPGELQAQAMQILRGFTEGNTKQHLAKMRKFGATRGEITKDKKDLESGKAVLVPTGVKPQDLKVGMVCLPWVREVSVSRILGDRSALVRFTLEGNSQQYETREIVLTELPTGSLTSDSKLQYGIEKDGETLFHPVIYVFGDQDLSGRKVLKAMILAPPDGVRFITPDVPL